MKSVNVFIVLWWENHTINSLPAFERLFELASRNQDLHSKLMCLEIREYRSFLIIKGN